MSLFSKKKAPRRKFRKKVVHSLEEDEEQATSDQPSAVNESTTPATATAPSATPAPPSNVPKSLLSFDDEDLGDGTEFKVKKSNHTQRVIKKLEQQRRREELQRQIDKTAMDESSDSEQENTLSSISQRISAGLIPDSSLIHAARKQREMARKMGTGATGGNDFISLDSNSTKKDSGRAKGKSRLVREDEYDKSDESEEEGRGTFGERREVSKQMQVLTAMEEAGSGSDEERFVEEQINKAVKGCVVSDDRTPHTYSITKNETESITSLPPTLPTQPQVTIPETLVPITVETLKFRLSQQLQELQSLHDIHTRRLEEMEEGLVTADREVGGLEEHINTMSLEYQFYQETRGYIRDLLSCLSEKVPQVEELETRVHSVLSSLTELRVERRQQDVRDLAAECNQTTPIDDGHKLRVVEREGRQRRRREARREKGVVNHHDGMSSDDELLETNRIKFKNDIDAVLSKRDNVFSDVREEFSTVSSIKSNLEQWKFSFPSSYAQAYLSLCLPKLFSPFVRLELLSWNPLVDECGAIEDCHWFKVLMFYGFLEGEEPEREDEDLLLIPNIVEKTVLPKLTALVKTAWDPLSSTQTKRLVTLLHTLFEDFPTVSVQEKNGLALVNAAALRLRQAIDGDVFVPLFAAKQMDNPSSPKTLFYHRQFWSCLKLLGNITKWTGLINVDTLQELVLDGLLNRYLLLSLQNSPVSQLSVEKVSKLVSLLPTAWYSDGSVVTRPLEGLVRYIVYLVECLDRAAAGQNDVERSTIRASIQKLVSCLQTLRAQTEALAVAEEHNLTNSTPQT